MKRELSGIDLLRRHARNWTDHDAPDRTRYLTSERTAGPARSRERVRVSAGRQHLGDDGIPAPVNNVADEVQNSRLDSLERLVRELSEDLVQERKAFAALAAEFERGGLPARRPAHLTHAPSDANDALVLIAERLEDIERTVDQRFAAIADGWASLNDRLGALEDQSGGGSPAIGTAIQAMQAKLDSMDRSATVMLDRVTGLVRKQSDLMAMETGSGTSPAPLLGQMHEVEARASQAATTAQTILERLSALEQSFEHRASETGRTVSSIGERLAAFESSVGSAPDKVETAVSVKMDELKDAIVGELAKTDLEDVANLHGAVSTLGNNQQALAQSMGHFASIPQRIETLETLLLNNRSLIETMASNIGVVYAILSRREENKSKFRNWLFGTDDWYSASWDTENWRKQMIEEGSFVPMPRKSRTKDMKAPWRKKE
jgi:hypothetical protein